MIPRNGEAELRGGHQTWNLSHLAIPVTTVFYSFLLIYAHGSTFATGPGPAAGFSNLSSSVDIDTVIGSSESEWAGASISGCLSGLKQRIFGFPSALTNMDLILFGVLILLALELLNFLVKFVGRTVQSPSRFIPVRGKHLDELSPKDLLFIGLNKVATPPFVYFLLRYMHLESNSVWSPSEATLMNVLAPLPVIFVIYDFFYTLLHWALHVKAIYGYIHKHHHHQKAPSRANVDAVNVHPIEFFLGEYNHMFALFLCCRFLNMKVHIFSVIIFLAVGGALAGINHTRYDAVVSFLCLPLYDSKNHDVHHRIPQCNYGQYIMLWDYIFGSYRPYNKDDRVNPKAQLDFNTGKSIEYMEAKKLETKRA